MLDCLHDVPDACRPVFPAVLRWGHELLPKPWLKCLFRTETVVGSGRNTNLLQDLLAGAIVQAVASVVLAQATMTRSHMPHAKANINFH